MKNVFTYQEMNKWRVVSLPATVKAANAANRGVKYQGSSKKDIYESLSSGNSFGRLKPPDTDKFRRIMNELVPIFQNHNDSLAREITKTIQNEI